MKMKRQNKLKHFIVGYEDCEQCVEATSYLEAVIATEYGMECALLYVYCKEDKAKIDIPYDLIECNKVLRNIDNPNFRRKIYRGNAEPYPSRHYPDGR